MKRPVREFKFLTLITVTSLPKSLAEFSLVTNPTGDGVLAIGGINGSDRQSAIYELFCNRFRLEWTINTQYGCYSTIIFTLKMTIFGLRMIVKIGVKQYFSNSSINGNIFVQNYIPIQQQKKRTIIFAWRDFKNIFLFSRRLFTITFQTKIAILDTDSNFRVKMMV